MGKSVANLGPPAYGMIAITISSDDSVEENMRARELRDALRRQPFAPFRVRLSTGQAYEVLHPEFAALTATSLFVGVPSTADEAPDTMIQCDLLHVVAIEPVTVPSTTS
jgi:hypothetical protein